MRWNLVLIGLGLLAAAMLLVSIAMVVVPL